MSELWFRAPYKRLLQKGLVTTTLRAGDRRKPEPKGYKVGEIIRLKIILNPGESNPRFDPWQTTIKILELRVKKIGELGKAELLGSPPDAKTKEAVKYNLGVFYNKEFTNKDVVTVIKFKYI